MLFNFFFFYKNYFISLKKSLLLNLNYVFFLITHDIYFYASYYLINSNFGSFNGVNLLNYIPYFSCYGNNVIILIFNY